MKEEMIKWLFGLNESMTQLNLAAIRARRSCRSQGRSRLHLNPVEVVRGAKDEWSAAWDPAGGATCCAANDEGCKAGSDADKGREEGNPAGSDETDKIGSRNVAD